MALGHAPGAWRDLVRRYGAVFALPGASASRERTRYRSDEAEFLPAALSLQQQAVSPAPRVAMWLLIAFAAQALAWSVLGRVDIVATAQGKIIPSEGTQVVQPIGTATVKAIHVREGQAVRAGDLLIELDGTVTRAEQQRIVNELQTWALQAAHAEAMLVAIDQGSAPVLEPVQADPRAAEDVRRLARAEYLALQAAGRHRCRNRATPGRAADHAGAGAQAGAHVAHRAPARRVAEGAGRRPVCRAQRLSGTRARAHRAGIGPGHAAQPPERDRGDHRRARGSSARPCAPMPGTPAWNRLNEARQRMALLEQDLVKARQSEHLTRLTAPVSGTVQQLAVRTVGGVVTEAQPLMLVVPQEHLLEIEAFLENKDVGFVRPAGSRGEDRDLSVYQHGIVPGTVKSVSDDAINDEKRGLVYSMRVEMARSTIAVNDADIRLAPGMAVTAEIKTGRRRVIEYFLDPLMQYGMESIRER